MPQKKFRNVDFICFTEKPRKAKGWEFKLVEAPVPGDNVRSNRHFKILPHLHLPGYEASIYIDSNFICRQLPGDFFMQRLTERPMWIFDHNQTIADRRNCVYKEFEALKAYTTGVNAKEDLEVLRKHIAFLRAENYPEENGLIAASVLIRKHNDPGVIAAMEHWWHMVSTSSRRDQLSFNYVAWKEGLHFGYLPGDVRRKNPWFYHVGKSGEPLFYSLLKYRIRTLLKSS